MFARTLHHISASSPRPFGQPLSLPPAAETGGALTTQVGASSPAAVAKIYNPDKKVSVVVYNMERFAQDCVNVFCELSGCDKGKIGTAPTPFMDESNDPLLVIEQPKGASSPQGGAANGGPRTRLRRKTGPLGRGLVS